MPSSSSTDQQARWEEAVRRLGLDPVKDARNRARVITTHSLKEYLSWFNPPPAPPQGKSVLSGKDLSAVSDERARRAIEDHIAGRSAITDDATIQALEDRFVTFHAEAYVAPDITISAQKPLIIDSTSSVTVYNNVTFQAGGYIKITVPCVFQSQTFTKTAGSGSSQYDIFVVGVDGKPGDPQPPGYSPKPDSKLNGSPGQCDCCGGIAEKDGTDGAQGAKGGPGAPGNPGNAGSSAPSTVVFQFGVLTGNLTLLNQGGAGGAGGAGGTGGTGQQGGDGGSYAKCGAEYTSGGSGGPGGPGGPGGDGGPGKDGTAGANITITYSTSTNAQVLYTNGIAAPGAGGAIGVGGPGGAGGASGGRGGKPGGTGDPGTNGVPGIAGQPGTAGTTSVQVQ